MNGDVQAGGVTVTESMINSMRSTKPWTKLLAILGFVGVGLMVLIGAAFVVFGNMFPQQNGAVAGVFYILFSVLYFMPSLYLYKFSSSIGNFLKSNGALDLESALSHQKSFWKFMGILALIGLVLTVLGIAAAVIIPMLAKIRMQG
jgi:hypothetical protein